MPERYLVLWDFQHFQPCVPQSNTQDVRALDLSRATIGSRITLSLSSLIEQLKRFSHITRLRLSEVHASGQYYASRPPLKDVIHALSVHAPSLTTLTVDTDIPPVLWQPSLENITRYLSSFTRTLDNMSRQHDEYDEARQAVETAKSVLDVAEGSLRALEKRLEEAGDWVGAVSLSFAEALGKLQAEYCVERSEGEGMVHVVRARERWTGDFG